MKRNILSSVVFWCVLCNFRFAGAAEKVESDAPAPLTPILSLVAPSTLPVHLTASSLKVLLKQSQVSDGPWAGTFRLAPSADRLNWHSSNLALYPLVNLKNYGLIRDYLNQYLNHVDAKSGTIQNVNLATSHPIASDSDDAYAASFLSLAVHYRQIDNNQVWWERNVTATEPILISTPLGAQKKSGLVRLRLIASQGGQANLMNNCEVYRGLKDFARTLREDNDSDAPKFAKAAEAVASGIAGLFDEEAQSFKLSDAPWPPSFYPERVGQVYPQLYAIPLGTTAETQRKYDAAWKYLNANTDNWETNTLVGTNDKSLSGFPWMLLRAVATKRGDAVRANR